MSTNLQVKSVSVSIRKGTPNQMVDQITLDHHGVQSDRHAGPGPRQVSLFDWDLMRERAPGVPEAELPGTENENIAVPGLSALHVLPLDELVVGEARLEVSVLGDRFVHGDTSLCADHEGGKHCAMGHDGLFARVMEGGAVKSGDVVTHRRRALRAMLITLSDRVSRGKAVDKSGDRAAELLGTWCADSMWDLDLDRHVIPDERDQLGALLHRARRERPHVVITTGGTGISPRDITPEVVRAHADKMIPGLMDHVRHKYGAAKPRVLLSRSVAAVIGESLVFALPGSTRAVEEYLSEITPLFEHMMLVLRGIDPH